jgi:2-oxoglutarate ferredoxin oxidoreductase subunit beta
MHRGFSFVDALSICPVQFGRRNNLGTPGEMIKWLRKNSISRKSAGTLSKEELRDRWVIGEFRAELDRTWGGYLCT